MKKWNAMDKGSGGVGKVTGIINVEIMWYTSSSIIIFLTANSRTSKDYYNPVKSHKRSLGDNDRKTTSKIELFYILLF